MKPLKVGKKHLGADDMVISESIRVLNTTDHKLFRTRQKGIAGKTFLDQGLQTYGTGPGVFPKEICCENSPETPL